MRTADQPRMGFDPYSLEATCETMLLGRLGSEIALIYHDTLQAPLPPRLQELIDRLNDVSRPRRPAGDGRSDTGN